MANVYTKKSKYPKTVTLRDFRGFYLTEFVKPRNPRCLSPTRGGNPHPSGLLYQDPYNRDNAWFGIWNPDPTKRNRKMSIMLPHIQRTNFTCGTYISPDTSSQRGPPNVKYSLASTHRSVFSKPRPCSGFLSHYTDVTRFAHTPRTAAIGIVPNSLPPVKGATSKPQSAGQEEETAETKTTMLGGSKTPQQLPVHT